MVDSAVRISVELDINEQNLNKSIEELQKNPPKIPVDIQLDTNKIRAVFDSVQSDYEEQGISDRRSLTGAKSGEGGKRDSTALINVAKDARNFLNHIFHNTKGLSQLLENSFKNLTRTIEVTSGQQIASRNDPFAGAFRGAIEGIGRSVTKGIGETIKAKLVEIVPGENLKNVVAGNDKNNQTNLDSVVDAAEKIVNAFNDLSNSTNNLNSSIDELDEKTSSAIIANNQASKTTSEVLSVLNKNITKIIQQTNSFFNGEKNKKQAKEDTNRQGQSTKEIPLNGFDKVINDLNKFGLSDVSNNLSDVRSKIDAFNKSVGDFKETMADVPRQAAEDVKTKLKNSFGGGKLPTADQINAVKSVSQILGALGLTDIKQQLDLVIAVYDQLTNKTKKATQANPPSPVEQQTTNSTTEPKKEEPTVVVPPPKEYQDFEEKKKTKKIRRFKSDSFLSEDGIPKMSSPKAISDYRTALIEQVKAFDARAKKEINNNVAKIKAGVIKFPEFTAKIVEINQEIEKRINELNYIYQQIASIETKNPDIKRGLGILKGQITKKITGLFGQIEENKKIGTENFPKETQFRSAIKPTNIPPLENKSSQGVELPEKAVKSLNLLFQKLFKQLQNSPEFKDKFKDIKIPDLQILTSLASKGGYDPTSKTVSFNPLQAENLTDAVETMLHEITHHLQSETGQIIAYSKEDFRKLSQENQSKIKSIAAESARQYSGTRPKADIYKEELDAEYLAKVYAQKLINEIRKQLNQTTAIVPVNKEKTSKEEKTKTNASSGGGGTEKGSQTNNAKKNPSEKIPEFEVPLNEKIYASVNNLVENTIDKIVSFIENELKKNQPNLNDAEAKQDAKNLFMDLSGSLAAGFALYNPSAFFQTLFAPLTIAASPLISAFTLLKNTLMPFVEQLNRLLVQLTPIQTRIRSLAETGFGGMSEKDITKEAQGIEQTFNLPILENRDSFSKFIAAAKGTRLEGKKSIEIYKGFATAIKALGLSTEDTKLVFLALQQMMSKGRLSAEEIRQQLSERLPGAISIFAKSLNMSTAEFNRLLETGNLTSDSLVAVAEELKNTYGDAVKNSSKSLTTALTRLDNAFTTFSLALVDKFGGALVLVTNMAASFMETLTGLKDRIYSVIALLAIDLSAMWLAGLASLEVATKGLQTALIALAPVYANLYKTLAPAAFGVAFDFMDEIIASILGVEIQGAVESISKGMFNAIYTLISGFEALSKSAEETWNTIRQVFGQINKFVGPVISLFGLFTKNPLVTGAGILTTLNGFFDFADVLKNIAKSVLPFITLLILMVQTLKLLQIISGLFKGVGQGFGVMWKTISEGSQTGQTAIRDLNLREKRIKEKRQPNTNTNPFDFFGSFGGQKKSNEMQFRSAPASDLGGDRSTAFTGDSRRKVEPSRTNPLPPRTKPTTIKSGDVMGAMKNQLFLGASPAALLGTGVFAAIIEFFSKAEIFNPLRKTMDDAAAKSRVIAEQLNNAIGDKRMKLQVDTVFLDSKGLTLDFMGFRELFTGKRVQTDDVIAKEQRLGGYVDEYRKFASENKNNTSLMDKYGRLDRKKVFDAYRKQSNLNFTTEEAQYIMTKDDPWQGFSDNPFGATGFIKGQNNSRRDAILKNLASMGIGKDGFVQAIGGNEANITTASLQQLEVLESFATRLQDTKKEFNQLQLFDKQGQIIPENQIKGLSKEQLNNRREIVGQLNNFAGAKDLIGEIGQVQSDVVTTLENAAITGETPKSIDASVLKGLNIAEKVKNLGVDPVLIQGELDNLTKTLNSPTKTSGDINKAVIGLTNAIDKNVAKNNSGAADVARLLGQGKTNAQNLITSMEKTIDEQNISDEQKTSLKRLLQELASNQMQDLDTALRTFSNQFNIQLDITQAKNEIDRLIKQVDKLNKALERSALNTKTNILKGFGTGLIDEPTKNALESTVNTITQIEKASNLKQTLAELEKSAAVARSAGDTSLYEDIADKIANVQADLAQAENDAAQSIIQTQQAVQQSITEIYKKESDKRKNILTENLNYFLASIQKQRQESKLNLIQVQGISQITDVANKLKTALVDYESVGKTIKDLSDLGQNKPNKSISSIIDNQLAVKLEQQKNIEAKLTELRNSSDVLNPNRSAEIEKETNNLGLTKSAIKQLQDFKTSGKLSNPKLLQEILGDYKRQFAELTNQIAQLQNELQDTIVNTLADNINQNVVNFDKRIDLALQTTINSVRGGDSTQSIPGAEMAAASEKYLIAQKALADFQENADRIGLKGDQRKEKEIELVGKLTQATTNLIDKRQALIDLATKGELAIDDQRIKNLRSQLDAYEKLANAIKQSQDAVANYSRARNDLSANGIRGQIDAINKLQELQDKIRNAPDRKTRKDAVRDSRIIRGELGLSTNMGSIMSEKGLQKEKDALDKKLYDDRASALVSQQKIEQVLLNLEIERQKVSAKMALTEALISEQKAKQIKLEAQRKLSQAKTPEEKALATQEIAIASNIENLASQASQIARDAYQGAIQSGKIQIATQQITQANERVSFGNEVLINSPKNFKGVEGILDGSRPMTPQSDLPTYLQGIGLSPETLAGLDTQVQETATYIDEATTRFTNFADMVSMSTNQIVTDSLASAAIFHDTLESGANTFNSNLQAIIDNFGTGMGDVSTTLDIAIKQIASMFGMTSESMLNFINIVNSSMKPFADAVNQAIVSLKGNKKETVKIPEKLEADKATKRTKSANQVLQESNIQVAEDYSKSQSSQEIQIRNPLDREFNTWADRPNFERISAPDQLTFPYGLERKFGSTYKPNMANIQKQIGLQDKRQRLVEDQQYDKNVIQATQEAIAGLKNNKSIGEDLRKNQIADWVEMIKFAQQRLNDRNVQVSEIDKQLKQLQTSNQKAINPVKPTQEVKRQIDKGKSANPFNSIVESVIQEMFAITGKSTKARPVIKHDKNMQGGYSEGNTIVLGADASGLFKDQILKGDQESIELLVHELRHWMQNMGLTGGSLNPSQIKDADIAKEIQSGLKFSGDNKDERDAYTFENMFIDRILKRLGLGQKPVATAVDFEENVSPDRKGKYNPLFASELSALASQYKKPKQIGVDANGAAIYENNDNRSSNQSPSMQTALRPNAPKQNDWLVSNFGNVVEFLKQFPNNKGGVTGGNSDITSLADLLNQGKTSKEIQAALNIKNAQEKDYGLLQKINTNKMPLISSKETELSAKGGESQIVLNVTNNINGVSGGNTQLVADKITNTIFGKLKNAFDSASQQF